MKSRFLDESEERELQIQQMPLQFLGNNNVLSDNYQDINLHKYNIQNDRIQNNQYIIQQYEDQGQLQNQDDDRYESNSSSEIANEDPENDGLIEPEIMFEAPDQEVEIYDINEKTGEQTKNYHKSYTLEYAYERIGVMVNKDIKYYDKKAIKKYQKNAKKLMKYTSPKIKKSPNKKGEIEESSVEEQSESEDSEEEENEESQLSQSKSPARIKDVNSSQDNNSLKLKTLENSAEKNRTISTNRSGKNQKLKSQTRSKSSKRSNKQEHNQKEHRLIQKQLYMCPNAKFDILNAHFGISSLALNPTAGNLKKMKKQLRKLKNQGSLIAGGFKRLKDTIKILSKQGEKKQEKEKNQLVPLLQNLKFFKEKRPMNNEELQSVCNFLQYMKKEPGETIFTEGDTAEHAYVILKGQVQVQIPDPFGNGLIEPLIVEEVEEEVHELVKEIDQNKRLTKDEIEKLDPKEQRKYKTKIMLMDILNSQNVPRLTLSMGQAIQQQSQVQNFIKLKNQVYDNQQQYLNPFSSKIEKNKDIDPEIQYMAAEQNLKSNLEKWKEKAGTFLTGVKNQNDNQKIESQKTELLQLTQVKDKEQIEEDVSVIQEMKGTKNDLKKKLDEDEFGLFSDGNEINPIELIDPGFIEIARLEAGGSFGELALIDGKPRMATIKCLKRCHFLVLSKKEYLKSLDEIKSKKKGLLVNYLRNNIPIFNKLTRTYLGKLSDNTKELKITKDFVLFKEGDIADRVYIVKDGEYVVTKKIESQNQQPEDVKEIRKNPKRANMVQNKFFNKNSIKLVDKHTLAYIGPGKLVGEEDIAMGQKYFTTTVKCVSQEGNLLVIQKDEFNKLQAQSTSWNILLTQVKDKLKKYHFAMKHTSKAREHISNDLKSQFLQEKVNAPAEPLSTSQSPTRPQSTQMIRNEGLKTAMKAQSKQREQAFGETGFQNSDYGHFSQNLNDGVPNSSQGNRMSAQPQQRFRKGLIQVEDLISMNNQPSEQHRVQSVAILNGNQFSQNKFSLGDPVKKVIKWQSRRQINNNMIFSQTNPSEAIFNVSKVNRKKPQAFLFMTRRALAQQSNSVFQKNQTGRKTSQTIYGQFSAFQPISKEKQEIY